MDDGMLRMQQEAVERVRQMQERARKFVEHDHPPAEETQVQHHVEEALVNAAPEHRNTLHKKGSIFDAFGEDQEQLLLLLLAVLLIKNNARIELVLALLYIAM